MAVVMVGGISFYGGMTYAKSNSSAAGAAGARGQFAAGQFATRTGTRGAGGFTTGAILSKDATSATVKLQDGSTKIVLFGTSTQIMKTSAGGLSDVTAGTNVVVTGTSNSDGSITAQSIQIRPAGMTGGPGGQRGTPGQ